MAETDATFARQGQLWVGKCLICNGPIAFDAATGEGATLEHILARSRGGTDDPHNNAEKGRRWDKKRLRPQEEYEALVRRFHERRQQRWREA